MSRYDARVASRIMANEPVDGAKLADPSPAAGKDRTDSRNEGIDLRRRWVENHFLAEFDREERAAISEID
jgi:hypothetical protein